MSRWMPIFVGLVITLFISKVSLAQTISTLAGDGTAGFSGDGGSATSASLNAPTGMFVDGSGNLFIADRMNSRIRQVDAAGIINTVAGDITFGFSGDGGPATGASLNAPSSVFVDGSGTIFIADAFNHRIRQVDAAGIISTVVGGWYRRLLGGWGTGDQC